MPVFLVIVVEHSTFLFLLFLIPLLGWLAQNGLPDKILARTTVIAAALFLPVIFGYHYRWKEAGSIFLFLTLTTGFGWLLGRATRKAALSLILSGVLLFVGGFFGFIGSMGGSLTIERTWQTQGYVVQYTRDQGFAGSPNMYYQLNKIAWIPLFQRKVEKGYPDSTTGPCTIAFKQAGWLFNKCEPDSSRRIK